MKSHAIKNRIVFVGLAALLSILPIGSYGQVASAEAPEASAGHEARTVVERALVKYRGLKSYQDLTEWKTVRVMENGASIGDGRPFESNGYLAFKPPKQMAMTLPGIAVYRDGERRWTIFENIYCETKDDEKAELLASLPEKLRGELAVHPVALVMSRRGRTFEELFAAVKSLDGVTSEVRDGAPGKRVHGRVEVADLPKGDDPSTFSAWFADSDGLLREIRVDLTATMNQLMADYDHLGRSPAFNKFEYVMRFDQVSLDAEISPDRLVFKPEPDLLKVDVITDELVATPAEQRGFIGSPAPPFASRDLDGNPVSLESLKGRVLLLEFWATWCGPCIAALPQTQRLAEKFADRPVTILGVNTDNDQMIDQARNLLKSRGITFTQIRDYQHKMTIDYHASVIPYTVLIDRKGKISHIVRGFTPHQEQELTERIEEALAEE